MSRIDSDHILPIHPVFKKQEVVDYILESLKMPSNIDPSKPIWKKIFEETNPEIKYQSSMTRCYTDNITTPTGGVNLINFLFHLGCVDFTFGNYTFGHLVQSLEKHGNPERVEKLTSYFTLPDVQYPKAELSNLLYHSVRCPEIYRFRTMVFQALKAPSILDPSKEIWICIGNDTDFRKNPVVLLFMDHMYRNQDGSANIEKFLSTISRSGYKLENLVMDLKKHGQKRVAEILQ